MAQGLNPSLEPILVETVISCVVIAIVAAASVLHNIVPFIATRIDHWHAVLAGPKGLWEMFAIDLRDLCRTGQARFRFARLPSTTTNSRHG